MKSKLLTAALALVLLCAGATHAAPRALTTATLAKSLLTLAEKAARAGLKDEASAIQEAAHKLTAMPVRTGTTPEEGGK